MSDTAGTFSNLVRTLSDEERKRLYARITKSLGYDETSRTRIYPSELHREQRESLIERDIARLPLGLRIRFFFRKLFGRGSAEDAFISVKLGQMKRHVRRSGISMEGPAPVRIGPELGVRVFSLYQAAYPIIPFFVHIWDDLAVFQQIVHEPLRRRIPGAKSRLDDFIHETELESIYMNRQNHGDLRTEVQNRIDEYISSIHDDVLTQIAEGLMPLYYLRDVCLFDYHRFFHAFGAIIGSEPPTQIPNFQPATGQAVLPQLDDLYYALYAAGKARESTGIHGEILEAYEAIHASELGEEADGSEAKRLSDGIEAVKNATSHFDARTPIDDIIRFLEEDPYYRFIVYVPKLNLKEFYHNALKVNVLSELDQRFPDIRAGTVRRMIESIFGKEPPDFAHFRESVPDSLAKLGLRGFSHVKSLNILYNYIQQIYRNRHQDFVRSIGELLPTRRKSVANDLAFHSAGIEDMVEKIRSFDYSFSPEGDNGKRLYRLRYAVERDASQHRLFQEFVSQINREASSLTREGVEHLQGLERIFRELISDLPSGLADQFQRRFAGLERPPALDALLKERVVEFANMARLVATLLAIERES
ncbi:MAG: hypothetical protein GVY29_03650 [Spirochaetes bacterium]|nr:hypothetical protein [Spirochaetota bacterium]